MIENLERDAERFARGLVIATGAETFDNPNSYVEMAVDLGLLPCSHYCKGNTT